MRRSLLVIGALAVLAGLSAARSEQIDTSEHWDISTATQKNTDFRKRICLNGFWQFSALEAPDTEPDGQWGYLKVPGGTRMQFVVHDQLRHVDVAATDRMLARPYGLYRRTFYLDDSFADGKIYLYVAYLWHSGTIYVNGQKIAEIVPAESIAKRTVEITKAVRIGAENEVKILVANEAPVRKGRRRSTREHQAGICDDVWLLTRPAGPRIDHLAVATSVEHRKLHLKIRLADVTDQKLKVAGRLYEHLTRRGKSGRCVLELPPQQIVPSEDGEAKLEVDLSERWDDLHLWSFENPALYDLVLDLYVDDKVADQVAERIGLRETKIVGHQFYLNGTACHVRDLYKFFEKHSRRRFAQIADVRVFRKYVRMYKRAGWNLAHTFSAYEPYLDACLDVMDEEGLMYYPLIIGVSGYRSIRKDPEMFRKITEAIEHFGNHPSLILWSMFTTGGFRTEESIRNPWAWTLKYGPKYATTRSNAVADGHKAFFDHIKRCDPHRPTMFGTLTNFGQGITGFYYPNFGTPIQEIESWPVKWFATAARKAHWTLESTFYYLACWADQRLWKGQQEWAEQVYENAARSLGPAAYTTGANGDPSPDIRPYIQQARPGDKIVGKTIMHTGHNPVYQERMSHFVTRVMRSWRAYDIACCGLGDEFGIMFDVFRSDDKLEQPVASDYRLRLEQLKTPGPKVDALYSYERLVNLTEPSLPSEAPPSDIYDSMRNNAVGPFLAFIAGDDNRPEQLTWKDHAYVSSQQITKNIVLINDHAEPRRVSYRLRFGRSIVKEGGVDMQPGHIQFIRASFKAPRVKQRTDMVIELEAQIAPGRLARLPQNVAADIINSWPSRRTDSFAVQVFPDAETRIDPGDLRIALYDETGRTRELMQKARLKFSSLRKASDLNGCNLVVVGRDSFTDKFRAFAAETDLPKRIRSGECDMLVFEQSRSRCAFDRELVNASAREVFITDRSHPAVAGLTDADLANWRGETDLQPSAPPVMGYMRPGTPYFPKWTNEGVVSSFPLLKPEYGNFRVILDCWFDLGYTPLCEVFLGAGSVMFCQLDVTNDRFGIDPAATRIVRNLFAYYEQRASQARSDRFGLVYHLPGDELAEKLLSERGATYDVFAEGASGGTLVVVAPGDSDDALIKGYVSSGGKVLYLTDATTDVDASIVPDGVVTEPSSKLVYEPHWGDPLLRGLGISDLHFKGAPRLLTVPGGQPLADDGLIARIDHGAGFYLFAPWIDAAKLEGLRRMSAPKVERLYSTLLTNLGVEQTGVHVLPVPPKLRKSRVLAKWDFETSDHDGTEPFENSKLVSGRDKAGNGKRCIKSRPLRKTWCAVGIPGVKLNHGLRFWRNVYLGFQYYLNKPAWLLVVLKADGERYEMSKRLEVDQAGEWTTACIRLDRFEGFPPAGLDGVEASMLELYAGDPDEKDLELRIDDVTFYEGPPATDIAPAYIPLFTRGGNRYPYDPDTYVRW